MAVPGIAPASQQPPPLPARSPSPALAPSLAMVRLTGKVKGTLLIARVKFVRSRGDADAGRVLRRLTAEDRATLEGTLLPSGWYPAGLLQRLETTAAALLTGGDRRELYLEMGRFTAATNLAPAGSQRPFVRESDPHFLLENVPRIYASQHSAGHRLYEKTGPSSAIIRHFDKDGADPDDCLTTVGWLEPLSFPLRSISATSIESCGTISASPEATATTAGAPPA